ncbi:hypothetical protein CCMA1212_004814 [Trichoderma ghanense]|uniref:RRM domain-containing protein n=1 Tax=Trichoderma ghanense TaxID=65468 RepID=A0ABY2H5S1_9HYPO
MKSKRAAAASAEDVRPVDGPQDQSSKKRKRSDDDADHSQDATAGKGEKRVKKFKEERKEKKKEKKEKEERDKEERKAKMPKKDKSKYNNKSRKEKKEELKNLQNLPEGMDVDDDEGSAKAAEAVTKPDAEVEPKTNGKSEDKTSKKQDKEDKKKGKKGKKDKKDKKKEKKSQENKDESSQENIPQGEDAIDLDATSAQKAGRNIVFVGNLPYSATATSITAHFASLKPVAVRCLTKKEDPKACRGIAFVEFATATHQRTCLDKFHHTMFDDGISPPRKINIELTAGGGGKGQGRKDKIMEKNKKLDENRAKRIEKEKTAKEENQSGNVSARMDIHPSRLARLPGLGH